MHSFIYFFSIFHTRNKAGFFPKCDQKKSNKVDVLHHVVFVNYHSEDSNVVTFVHRRCSSVMAMRRSTLLLSCVLSLWLEVV